MEIGAEGCEGKKKKKKAFMCKSTALGNSTNF